MSSKPFFYFEILHQSKKSHARVGRIHTPHGVIDTPNFVAVGTNAAIKAIDSKVVEEIGVQLLFCNTYHLILQPGSEVIQKLGGLHTFMNRQLPLITDSGGFQVFSLAYGSVASELKSRGQKKTDGHILKISEEGVLFRSYRNGAKVLLTPESSVQAQKALGADIIIPFDELPPYHIAQNALKTSLERTHRWEKRSLEEHKKNVNKQAMYAVVHGGVDPTLREESCIFLRELDFDGFAIGGSLGKSRAEMLEMLKDTMPKLPANAPKHLLGIGDLTSLEGCLPLGFDTFDSSYPTRAARHGMLLTHKGPIKIDQSQYKMSFLPIEENCNCYSCKHYTKAYIHHLFKAKELLALSLATIHNLHFMVTKMTLFREAIWQDSL